MPLFRRTTSHLPGFESTAPSFDEFLAATDRPFNVHPYVLRPATASLERPHTTSGVNARATNRFHFAFPSRHVSSRPSTSSQRVPASLTLKPAQAGSDPDTIGIACGSPPAPRAGHPLETFPSLPPTTAQEERPLQNAVADAAASDERSNRPNLKRWRTVSGLLARRKTSTNHAPAPVANAAEDSASRKTSSDRTGGRPRRSSHFARRPRASTTTKSPEKTNARPNKAPPLPALKAGRARAVEAGEENAGPRLNIQIPAGTLDRYSVMFSGILNRRPTEGSSMQPGDSGRQAVPGKITTALVQGGHSSTVSESLNVNKALPAEPTCVSPVSVESEPVAITQPPSRDPPPCPGFDRSSAVPPALFSDRSLSMSRPGVEQLKAVSEVEARAPHVFVMPSFGGLEEEEMHLWNEGLSSSQLASSPTSSAHSLYYPPTAPYLRNSTPLAFYDFPSPPGSQTTDLDDRDLYLSTPNSPSVSVSRDLLAPNESPTQKQSPRLAFGYDAPHSPLVSMATSVTVSLKSGHGQRAQYVVQETDGAEEGQQMQATASPPPPHAY